MCSIMETMSLKLNRRCNPIHTHILGSSPSLSLALPVNLIFTQNLLNTNLLNKMYFYKNVSVNMHFNSTMFFSQWFFSAPGYRCDARLFCAIPFDFHLFHLATVGITFTFIHNFVFVFYIVPESYSVSLCLSLSLAFSPLSSAFGSRLSPNRNAIFLVEKEKIDVCRSTL